MSIVQSVHVRTRPLYPDSTENRNVDRRARRMLANMLRARRRLAAQRAAHPSNPRFWQNPSRVAVRVTFEDGNTLVSTFNGTLEDARGYYLGQRFELNEEVGPVLAVDIELA